MSYASTGAVPWREMLMYTRGASCIAIEGVLDFGGVKAIAEAISWQESVA